MIRGRRLAVLMSMALAAAALAPAAAPPGAAAASPSTSPGAGDLHRYAADTWRSMVAMTDPKSGLPADSLGADGTTSVQTSTTNIGAYLWSAYAAQRLGIIGRGEMVARIGRTLTTL